MLLRDAHVDDPFRHRLREGLEAHGRLHGRGNRHDVRTLARRGENLVGEDGGPSEPLRLDGQAGLGMDLPHGVELVLRVALRGVIAAALLGEHVDDHGRAEVTRVLQRVLEVPKVVSVDRPDGLDAKVAEEALRGDDVAQPLLEALDRPERHAPQGSLPAQRPLAPVQDRLVARVGADVVELAGEAADRRRVGATVVVDDDDDAVVAVGDLVERLPRHAAGERAVADHRDDGPVGVPIQGVGPGDSRRPRKGGGRVGVLHDVVLGLGAARVAGEAPALAEVGEVLAPREELVDVALVPGVEHERVARRLEDPMDGERQLHDAKVGAQVTARLGDGVDEVGADLLGERAQVVVVEGREVLRRTDRLQHCSLTPSGRRRPL